MRTVSVVLFLALAGCDVEMSAPDRRSLKPEEIRAIYDAIGESAVHFRDPRTGLCYAHFTAFRSGPTRVDCTPEVLGLLANPEPEAASVPDGGAP